MISLNQKVTNAKRDQMELNYQEWKALYYNVKNNKFSSKQMKKNIIRYQDNIAFLVEKYPHQKRFSKHLKTFKNKFSQFNQEFKIHISSKNVNTLAMYKLFNFLHLEDFTSCIQFLIDHLLELQEFLVGHLQQKNNKILNMERQLDEWRIIKKNSMCFTCKGNIQQSKIRNLAIQIGSTVIQEKAQIQYIDKGHQLIQIQKQCRNIQYQLNQMGGESFFNEESANLVELINQIFKIKLNNFQKLEKRQNTSEYLQKFLKDINHSVRPAELIDTQDIDDLLSNKKLASSTKMVSLEDLVDNQKYVNKLKLMFSEPIKKFIQKYSSILEKKNQIIKPETRECQAQTSLIKQAQIAKNLQKSYNSMNKQLISIKQSKQKNQKQLIKTIQNLQKNQLKLLELTKTVKTLQNQNKNMSQQYRMLMSKYTRQTFELKDQIQSLLNNNINEKSQLNKKIKEMQIQLIKISKRNFAFQMNVSKINYGTQSYSTCNNLIDKELRDAEVQTQNQEPQMKITKKSMLKTLKSLKYKAKTGDQKQNQDIDEIQISRLKFSNISKSSLNKYKSELPFEKTVQQQFKKERQVQFTQNSNKTLKSRSNIDERDEFVSTIKTNIKSKKLNSEKSLKISNSSLKKTIQKESESNDRPQSERKPSITNLLTTSKEIIIQKSDKIEQNKKEKMDQPQNDQKINLQINLIKSTSSKILGSTPKIVVPLQINKKSIKFDQQNLKKVSKPVFDTKSKLVRNVFSHKKNVKSMLSSPSIQNQLVKQNQSDMFFNFKNNNFSKMTLKQADCCDYSCYPQNSQQQHQNFKKVIKFIKQNFQFLEEEGIIDLLKDIQIHKENIKSIKKSQLTHTQLSKIIQKVDKFHIDRKDLQLFFSINEAIKFQKNVGLWTELDNCIMVDTNFNHFAEDIDKYFQELKQKSKITYNEYFIFVDTPATFFKQIFNEDKNRQKAHLLKYTMKGIKPKHTVKDIFRKLIRLHKMLHKNCNHIENFLEKIGFKNKVDIENKLKKNNSFQPSNNNARFVNIGSKSYRQSLMKQI